MSKELIDDSALKPYEGDVIRKNVSDRIKYLRSKFKLMPLMIKRYNLRLADELVSKWAEEAKLQRKEKSGQKPAARLQTWKEMARRYRLYALHELSNRWYTDLRSLRGELALVVAMYQYSEIDRIMTEEVEWKNATLDEFNSLVLRMKGPKKPSAKKFKIKDIKYDVKAAFLEMMLPLEEWAEETKKRLDGLTAPKTKMTYATKLKRFRSAVKAREYLTVLTQSLAPRSESLRLMRDIQRLEREDAVWIQVFDDEE